MKRWSLLDSEFQSGAFHMAFDEALFSSALANPGTLPTLRVYGFRRPTITYGYSQRIAKHWLEDPFYESARRITGGGMVFHGRDLVYSFVGSTTDHPSFGTLEAAYRAFHEVARKTFACLGIPVEFAEADGARRTERSLCLLAPVKNDLLFRGQKIAGAAEKRSGPIFLHQGSINFRPFLRDEGSYLSFFEGFKEVFIASFRCYFQVDFVVQSAPQAISELPGYQEAAPASSCVSVL